MDMDYEPHEMNCLIKWLYRLSTASWMIVAVLIVYWEFIDDPDPVIVHEVSILPAGPHPVGATVTLHVDVCQTRPGVPGTGIRIIVGPLSPSGDRTGGFTHFLPGNYIDPLPECTKHERPIELIGLPAGKYNYVFQGVYQINPIKTKVFTQPPVPFEIAGQ